MAEDPKQLRRNAAHNVRVLRAARGWTQSELAIRAQCKPQYIATVEKGNENLTINSLAKLANGLDVTVIELLAAADHPLPSARRGRPPKRSAEKRQILL